MARSLNDVLQSCYEQLDSYDIVSTHAAEITALAQEISSTVAGLDNDSLARICGNNRSNTSNESAFLIHQSLECLTRLLTVPVACILPEWDMDATKSIERDRFLQQSPSLLQLALALLHLVAALPTTNADGAMIQETQASYFLAFARFARKDSCEGFVSKRSASTASGIVFILLSTHSRYSLLRYLLSKTFPPLFKPHPKLDPATGRVLSRPMGGDRGLMDWYEEGEQLDSWRRSAGLGNVVNEIVVGLKTEELEELWHWILPPLLTYLDDYEPENKMIGTGILSSLLDVCDASLLRRTGVGAVFQQSLSSSFSALSSPPASVHLLLLTHRTSLKLLALLHPPLPSPLPAPLTPSLKERLQKQADDRFDALSTLFVEGIAHVWEFKSGDLLLESTVLAVLLGDPFPSSTVSSNNNDGGDIQEHSTFRETAGDGGLLAAMSQSLTTRYLALLIPHLSALIRAISCTNSLGRQSARTLVEVMRIVGKDSGRMERWRGTIVRDLAIGWTTLRDEVLDVAAGLASDEDGEDTSVVGEKERKRGEEMLKELARALGDVSEVAGKVDLPRLRSFDPSFEDLFAE